MKTPALLAIALAAFALGAWCARPRVRAVVLSPVDAKPAANSRVAVHSSAAVDSADDRWSRLLSALHEPLFLHQRALMADALGDWSATEIAATVARAEELPRRFRAATLRALVARWFELDPHAAGRWTERQSDPAMLGIWAAHDPRAALRGWVASETLPRQSLEGWRLANQAPIGARERVAIVAGVPSSARRDGFLCEALHAWAAQEGGVAAGFAQSLSTRELRERSQWNVAAGWAGRDITQALAYARTLLPGAGVHSENQPWVTDFTRLLASRDLPAAHRWIAELPEIFRADSVAAVAQMWAIKEPIAALDWWQAQRAPTTQRAERADRVDFLPLQQVAWSQPEVSARWVLAQPPGEERDALLEAAALAGIEYRSEKARRAAAETWLRDLYREMPADRRARIDDALGDQAALLEVP
jgi:hypothetical protein